MGTTSATKELVTEFMRRYRDDEVDGMVEMVADEFVFLTRQGPISTAESFRAWLEETMRMSQDVKALWKVEAESYWGDYGLFLVSFGGVLPLVACSFCCSDDKIIFLSVASHAAGLLGAREHMGQHRHGMPAVQPDAVGGAAP